MRIAHLISQYPAASHTFIRREVNALREGGLDVHTFSVRPPLSMECVSDEDRVARDETYYLFPPRPIKTLRAHIKALRNKPVPYFSTLMAALRHRPPGAKSLLYSMFYFGEAIVLSEELAERGVAHLHNHFANPGATVGYLASRFLKLPWSLTLHGISETDYPAGVLLPEKLRAASFVVCVSHFGRAQAMRIVEPDHWQKMFVARCALDLRKLPSRERRRRGRVRIICVARLSPEKGHEGLLQAFHAMRAQGIDAELVLVGDGPERSRIEHTIRELDLSADVALVGSLPERETLVEISRADVLVLASFMEGLPVVLMEALAIGVPVVAPRVAGVPELVEHGREGLLFTPGNWSELTDALATLTSNEELRERMASAGRGKVEAEFEIQRAVEPLKRRLLGLTTDESDELTDGESDDALADTFDGRETSAAASTTAN